MQKKLLLISHVFIPISSPRSLRWGYFIRYLIDKGYKVDVLTILPSKQYAAYDENLLNIIPKQVNIIRTYPGPIYGISYNRLPQIKKAGDPVKTSFKSLIRRQLKKAFKKIIEPLLIPDKFIVWFPWALIALMKLKKENRYDLVISSAYAFTDHILGYCFKKWTGVKWIVDYGDPWAFNPGSSRWRYYIDKQIESRLLKVVDRVIVTTEETAQGFIKHYPFLESKTIDIISQGCDIQKYQKVHPETGKIFRIVYTGIFYNGIREPYTFFEAIKELDDLDLEVVVAGNVDSQYSKWIEEKRLQRKIIFLGHQKHQRTVALQKGADALLLFGWLNGYQIPGKIYEYFNALRPILAIKYDDQDISAKIIREHNRGIVVLNKKEDIKIAIRHLYNLKQTGQIEKHYNLCYLQKYSWQTLANKLETVIENVEGCNK